MSRPRSSRTSPSSRRSGRPGWPPSSGSGRGSRPTCRSSWTPSAATSASTAARQAVALFDAPRRGRRDGQPVPRRRGDRAAPRATRPLRLRPVPDVEPGRRRAPGPGVVAGRRRGRPGRTRCTSGSPGSRPAGDRAGRSASSSGRRRPRSCATIRAIAPGLPFLVPGVGAQGGAIDPVLRHGPAAADPGSAGRRRAAREHLAGHRRGRDRTAGPGDPAERLAAAAAAWAARLPVLP